MNALMFDDTWSGDKLFRAIGSFDPCMVNSMSHEGWNMGIARPGSSKQTLHAEGDSRTVHCFTSSTD